MGAILLFGGTGSTISLDDLDDTWEFSKATGWKQLKPSISPPPLTAASMAYDPTTETVVLFGGAMGTTNSNETWTWDGNTWTEQFPPISPSPREWNTNGMVFDSAIGKVVLFGGYAYNSGVFTFSGETWEWDGTSKTWTQKFPVHAPSPRAATLAYDVASRQVLLFGGFTAQFAFTGDTWIYNGVDWVQQKPATIPPPRTDNALAFDPRLHAVVMFGGLAGASEAGDDPRLNDTWLWGGTDWTQVQTSFTPSPRSGTSFGDDPTLGMLLFGGWISPSAFTSTTWFFGPIL